MAESWRSVGPIFHAFYSIEANPPLTIPADPPAAPLARPSLLRRRLAGPRFVRVLFSCRPYLLPKWTEPPMRHANYC